MIRPYLQNDVFLADVTRAAEDRHSLHLWWLGQSGFLVLWQGKALLLDPYLSDSLTKKYAGTDKPHVRLTERVISPEKLNFIQVVTSSHNHTDHLDAETLRPLLQANPGLAILVGAANTGFAAQRLQVDPGRLTPAILGQPVEIAGFRFHALPSAHEQVETDESGNPKCIGLVVQAGPWTLYHSGDTLRYPEMAALLQPWKIDLGLLPINGRDPARGVAGNLSGPEAVALARESGMRLVIPCHYEMFAFNTVSPQAFEEAARAAGQPYHRLRAGERLTLTQ